MVKQVVFKDFSEWWYYARALSEKQRDLVFSNLSDEQQHALEDSYAREGWEDVFCRNEIDEILDGLKEKYGYDVLDIKVRVLRGKSVYLPAKFWELVTDHLAHYKAEDVKFAVYGIRATACKVNPNVVLLTPDFSDADVRE